MNAKTHKKKKHRHAGDPCHYCGLPMTANNSNDERPLPTAASEDHIILKSRGGTREAHNIVIACTRCNNLRGDTNYEIFLMFSRFILRKYPHTPTPYLRLSLNQFIQSLAEIAIFNAKESRRALGIALLSIKENLIGRNDEKVHREP